MAGTSQPDISPPMVIAQGVGQFRQRIEVDGLFISASLQTQGFLASRQQAPAKGLPLAWRVSKSLKAAGIAGSFFKS